MTQTQSAATNNQGKKTLCYFHSEIIGVVEALVEVGGIYQLAPALGPLVCTLIQDYPDINLDGTPNEIKQQYNCEKIAIFHHDPKISSKYRKSTSQKQEKTLAKKMKGRTQPGSGSIASFKGDVITDDFLIEAKFTDKNNYRLQLKIWNKIKSEAYVKSKIPLMEVCLNQDKVPVKLLIIDPLDFYDITEIDANKITDYFSIKPLTGTSSSVNLIDSVIKQHIDYVDYNQQGKMPAFLMQIDKQFLIGIEIDNFLKVTND